MVNTEHGWRGGENQVWLLATGLSARFESHTVCQAGDELEHRLSETGALTVPITARGGLDLLAARRMRRVIKELDIAIVHAHTSHAHSLSILACLGTRVPLVVTRRVAFSRTMNPLSRWKYRRANRLVAVSEGVKRALVAGGVSDERIEVIHDGIDFDRLAPATEQQGKPLREELAIPADATLFGIVAQLTAEKDHATLLRAFVQVEAALPSAWLVIIGDGELERDLTALAGQLRLERVRFAGYRRDISNVLRALDCFILCSRHEGLGSSIMDAMHVGLPVVATRVGGIPELITDGADGVMIEAGDPVALSAALLRIGSSPEERARLGAAARATAAARFPAVHMVSKYEALYERVLGGTA